MCSIDLEPCEVWKETERVARKEHRCNTCHARINPGDRYAVIFTISEGYARSEKECSACRREASDFFFEHGTRGNPSTMEELYDQCLQDALPDYGDDGEPLPWKDGTPEARWRAALDRINASRRAAKESAGG